MAGSWRLAGSLVKLQQQLNAAYPNRNKASDGTIGDQSHASGPSDHNPNQYGVVCAFDITNSPETGFDAHVLADHLMANPHPNLKYIISNGRIGGWWNNYTWETYAGTDPHDRHIHISVGKDGGGDGKSLPPYDDTTEWNIIGAEEMAKYTREQEMVAAMMATGSYPGDNYNYQFSVQDINSETLNQFLQFWSGQTTRVTAELEKTLAKIATGSPYGKDYNSPFQGKPVLSVLPQMLAFWLAQRTVTVVEVPAKVPVPVLTPTKPAKVKKPRKPNKFAKLFSKLV